MRVFLQVVMPVCDFVSGPFCPHIRQQALLQSGPPRPQQCSPSLNGPGEVPASETEATEDDGETPDTEPQSSIPASSTSPLSKAFEQNPDLFLAYVHRVPLQSPSSSTADSPTSSSGPAACRVSTSSSALVSRAKAAAGRPENPTASVCGFGACVGVDWDVTYISRDRSALYGHRTPRHHPEIPYQTRGLFLENGIGDVSSSPAMSEALSSAIGQIGLGRSTLDDVWAGPPSGGRPSPQSPPPSFQQSFPAGQKTANAASASSAVFPLETFSRAGASTSKFGLTSLPSEHHRFICFVRQPSPGTRGRDQSRCISAVGLDLLPPNLKASTEPVPRGWVATSHLLTFDKSKAPFAYPFLEPNYASGLPLDTHARWTGLWEVVPVDQGTHALPQCSCERT